MEQHDMPAEEVLRRINELSHAGLTMQRTGSLWIVGVPSETRIVTDRLGPALMRLYDMLQTKEMTNEQP